MSVANSISIAVAVVGVFLSVYFFLRSRRIRKIQVSQWAATSVLEVRESIPDLKILHRNREIEELYVLEFKITNAGTLDIDKGDLENTPISCRTGAEVVNARVTGREPESLDFDVERWEHDVVVFRPSLFKRGEAATVKLTVLSEPKLDFSETRIPNVRPVEIQRPRARAAHLLRVVFFAVTAGLATAAVISLIQFFLFSSKPDSPNLVSINCVM